jgi:serine/threonine protein kinase
VGPYTLVEEIGQGGFATVWLATDEEGNTVAVKRFSADHGREVDKEKAANERACLERLRHPNVLTMLDAVADEAGVDSLVLEYCEAGDLIHKMTRVVNGGPKDESESFQIWHQIIDGIGHMHERGVAHLDLKPQNVLLANEDAPCRIKLCDFSHSFISSSPGALVPASQVGAGKYMAPEVSSGDPYDGCAADTWSCGVILYTLLTGTLPFEDKEKIATGEWRQVDWFSEPLNVLLSNILQPVASRWSLADVHGSAWVKLQRELAPPELPAAGTAALMEGFEEEEDDAMSYQGYGSEEEGAGPPHPDEGLGTSPLGLRSVPEDMTMTRFSRSEP